MAKHRKTRQEKILADQRHITYHLEITSAQASIPTEKKVDFKLDLPQDKHQTVSYAYVGHDLRKTSLVTISIVFFQIILFVILGRI